MKHIQKNMVFFASLFVTTGLIAAAATTNTTCQKAIAYRSQSLSLQRNMCAKALNVYEMEFNMDRVWGFGSIAPGYQASFDSKSMTNTPCSNCDVTSPSQWNIFVKGGLTFN